MALRPEKFLGLLRNGPLNIIRKCRTRCRMLFNKQSEKFARFAVHSRFPYRDIHICENNKIIIVVLNNLHSQLHNLKLKRLTYNKITIFLVSALRGNEHKGSH